MLRRNALVARSPCFNLAALTKTGGRNNSGKITTRHIGGGHKQAYRLIDFKRYDKDGVPAKVAHIEYDPNRTARVALLHFADGEKRYIIAPEGLGQGSQVEAGERADIKPGNNLPLRNIPVGTTIHAVELRPGRRRQARPVGWFQHPVGRQRGKERHAPDAVGRNANG